MLHVQKYLQNHTLDDLKNDFGIHFKVYDDRVLLKYRIDSKPKFHPIVRECRGLILSLPDFSVMSRAFDRFFNLGEGDDKDIFNWDNCIIFNKYDGSLINVYHDGNVWCCATSGTAFAEGCTPMGKTYHDLFIEAIGGDLQSCFDGFDSDNTYIFELTSPENRIVTRYPETKAILIGIRNKINGLFIDYNNVKDLSFAKVCESYDLCSPDDIVKFVESRDQLDEGVVCYDINSQMRIKVKNPSYVSIHHLRGNEVTVKSIITLLLKGEMDEYLTYFPEDKDLIQPYSDKFNELKTDITSTYALYKNIKDQKEFALEIKDFPYKSFLFSLRKGITMEAMFNMDNSMDKIHRIIKYFE